MRGAPTDDRGGDPRLFLGRARRASEDWRGSVETLAQNRFSPYLPGTSRPPHGAPNLLAIRVRFSQEIINLQSVRAATIHAEGSGDLSQIVLSSRPLCATRHHWNTDCNYSPLTNGKRQGESRRNVGRTKNQSQTIHLELPYNLRSSPPGGDGNTDCGGAPDARFRGGSPCRCGVIAAARERSAATDCLLRIPITHPFILFAIIPRISGFTGRGDPGSHSAFDCSTLARAQSRVRAASSG